MQDYCEDATVVLEKSDAPTAKQFIDTAEIVRVAGTHYGPKFVVASVAVSVVRL